MKGRLMAFHEVGVLVPVVDFLSRPPDAGEDASNDPVAADKVEVDPDYSSSIENLQAQRPPATGSGGQPRHSVRMRGSMLLAKRENSTMPTGPQANGGRFFLLRVSWTRHSSMRKIIARLPSHSTVCLLMAA